MDKDNDGLVMLIPGEESPKVTPKTEEPVTEDPEAIDVFNFFADNDELNPQRLWKPWMDEKKFVLGTVDNITQIMDECIESGRYALDLETTGLDNRLKKTASGHYCTVDHIAGVCLSADGVTGYYIPIHHVKVGEDGLREDRACNIPIGIFDREFRRLIKATEDGLTVADFHNGKFDQEFLQFNETGIPWGEWDRPAMWDDTLIAAYMRNTRARRRGLKALSEAPVDSPPENTVGGPGLGMEMIDLYELWGHKKEQRGFNYDFSVLDPTEGPALWYGCSDAICTWLLDPVLMPSAKEKDTDGISQAAIYKIEKVCVAATRWMERNLIHINRDKVQELVSLGQQEWFDSIVEVYTEASKILGRDVMPDLYKEVQRNFVANDPDNLLRTQLEKADSLTKRNPGMPPVLKGEESWPAVYDVNSQKQLGTMFNEMEVPGLKFTEKSGQVKTSKDELNRIIEEAGQKFPFMAKIKRFREVAKALSTYLESMLLASDPEDDSMRINFNGHKVDTGRFSTPAKESAGDRRKGRMIGWPELNVQSMPNRYDPDRPECMNRLRECFGVRTVPKDAPPRFLVAIDYAGVELRLATNISGEPKWLAEFFHCSSCDRTFERTPRTGADIIATITPVPPPARCPNCGSDKIGDLHTLTGLSIYGADATSRPDWKNLRGHSKATNFALSYGGGGSAVCRATGVDRNEGQRIKNQFDNTYYGLKRWWNSQHKYAKTYGYVRTAFGRKYPVPDIYNEDGGFRSKAERNSVNGPIQGCIRFDERVASSIGLLDIQTLFQRQFPGLLFWTGVKWVAGRVLASGEKLDCCTELSNGNTLHTSPDHQFRVLTEQGLGWVAQKELCSETWVVTNATSVTTTDVPHYQWDRARDPQRGHLFSKGMTSHNAKRFLFAGNSAVLWEFLGAIYGDGSIQQNAFILHIGESNLSKIPAGQRSSEWMLKLNTHLQVEAITRKQRRREDDNRQDMWQVKVLNKDFRTFCRDVLGVLDQTTHTKRFPVALWSETSENRAAFLRGYFDTDGTVSPRTPKKADAAPAFRSANFELLSDTQKLLHSLGIRASLRRRGMWVRVLDRTRFRDLVGSSLDYKRKRLDDMRVGYYHNQRHCLPPFLVKKIGRLVKTSSVYAPLPRAKKSAVLRMVAGAASKEQCLVYFNQLPIEEQPEELRRLLQYDYEKAVLTEQSERTVPMYDVEIFDEDHAFVCNNIIVHNSSADVTKTAMALIYKECKRRGWLDKVAMNITMHDELVFEVDADVLEEAVPVLVDLMVANDYILVKNWPVPFTTDVEIGTDWTVPWDLNAMRYGEVRFHEGKKYGKKKDLPEGVVWDDLPSWPEELAPWFKEAQGAPAAGVSTSLSVAFPKGEAPEVPSVVPVTSLAPTAVPGEDYFFQLPGPMTYKLAGQLAEIIAECHGKGSSPLRLRTVEGIEVEGWLEGLNLTTIRVSPVQLETLIQYVFR